MSCSCVMGAFWDAPAKRHSLKVVLVLRGSHLNFKSIRCRPEKYMKTKPSGWKTPVCKIHNIPEKTLKVVQRAGAMDKTIDEFHFKNSPPPFTK